MRTTMPKLFDRLPTGTWVCWDRPPVMYVCYNADVCSYYPMDTGIEARGPFPLFSWEFALATDGRGGFYVTGGHDENLQVRVQDPYAVGHKPPFPDSFFGPMVSELWRYDIRANAWQEVDQQAWGPRQCVAARHMTDDPVHNCLIRTASCREGHTPRPPVPLRGWGIFGFWRYEIGARRWTWMTPFPSMGPLTFDTRRNVALGYREGRVGVYDLHSNTAFLRPAPRVAPKGEGAFAYDRAHDVCLFQGESGETWAYDIENNRWSNRKPKSPVRPRRGFGFALDPESGTAILFGGRGRSKRLDDTWLYDFERNVWKRIQCPMRPEGRFWWGKGIVFDETNRTFVLYGGLALYPRVRARYATGDIWLFKLPRVRKARSAPPAPRLTVRCGADRIRLDWSPVPGAAGYGIERGTGVPGAVRFTPLAERPAGSRTFTDARVRPGTRYEYRVRALGSGGQPGAWSLPARTDPAVPEGLVVSVLGRRRVDLTWAPCPEPDVEAYRVRRVRVVGDDRFVEEREFEVGSRPRFADSPAGLPRRHYQYQVQAVTRLGVASGWSAPAGTIPSAPARLVMKPDAGRRCVTLIWPANPEQGIAGYNIYRWVEPPFRFAFKTEPELITPAWWTFDPAKNPAERMQWVKVNQKPIAGTRFVDRNLKLVNTWYTIRAVNRLGVEGHFRTSYAMPVWRWYTDTRRFY